MGESSWGRFSGKAQQTRAWLLWRSESVPSPLVRVIPPFLPGLARETHLQTEIPLINANISYRRLTSQFSEFLLSLLFLKITSPPKLEVYFVPLRKRSVIFLHLESLLWNVYIYKHWTIYSSVKYWWKYLSSLLLLYYWKNQNKIIYCSIK